LILPSMKLLSMCPALVLGLARAGRSAQRVLATMPSAQRAQALRLGAAALRRAAPAILEANALDVVDGKAAGLSSAMVDRLRLDPARINSMADAVEQVAGSR
jgi:glutamate-5-semialdehyde dehydrogenase